MSDEDESPGRAHGWRVNAHGAAGGRYTKIYSQNPHILCQFLRKALEEYKALVRTAGGAGSSVAHAPRVCMCQLAFSERAKVKEMVQELQMCREMIELLPLKMDRIMSSGRPMR